MKSKFYILTITIIPFFISCEISKLETEARKKAISFFSALKENDESTLIAMYSKFKNFDTYYKSDSFKINSVSSKKDIITVSIYNRFTNGFGKLSESHISLFLKKDSTGQLKIFDSKGLSKLDSKDEYLFGISTGCINKDMDTTDQQMLKALKKAKLVMLDKGVDVYLELKKNIQVVNWNWESGYGGSASGKGIVKNGSTFSIPQLKYKITYKTSSGEAITTDDGYVTYDRLKAGESRSFSFYTSYVGSSSRASIDLEFDEDLIFKYLSNKDWTGRECEEYYKVHAEKLKDL